MKKEALWLLIGLLAGCGLVACRPSQAGREGPATASPVTTVATQTEAAALPAPTATSLPKPPATRRPAPMPTATLYPVPEGWRDHDASGLHIALPEGWEAVDVKHEGFEALWQLAASIDAEWARNVTAMFSAEDAQEALRFWAVDTQAAITGYPSLTVVFSPQPFPVRVDDLCTQMPPAYRQMGLEVVEAECDLEINQLDVARFILLFRVEPQPVKQYQYLYVQEGGIWIVSLGVRETAWSEYEPVFAAAANSFRVDR